MDRIGSLTVLPLVLLPMKIIELIVWGCRGLQTQVIDAVTEILAGRTSQIIIRRTQCFVYIRCILVGRARRMLLLVVEVVYLWLLRLILPGAM